MAGMLLSDVSLRAMRQDMIRLLTQLDEADEHVIAAHLMAALDALEDRLGLEPERHTASAADRPIDQFSRKLLDHFGARAETLAREQLAMSSGEALLAWATIVGRLHSGAG